jgi:hypothetical protein
MEKAPPVKSGAFLEVQAIRWITLDYRLSRQIAAAKSD